MIYALINPGAMMYPPMAISTEETVMELTAQQIDLLQGAFSMGFGTVLQFSLVGLIVALILGLIKK